MRLLPAIICSTLSSIVGFFGIFIFVMLYRFELYPELQEFDIGGLLLALASGVVGAFALGMCTFHFLKRRAEKLASNCSALFPVHQLGKLRELAT